jgi:hypothetical protein
LHKENKNLLKVALTNIVKLNSAADYNVTYKSDTIKLKKKNQTAIKPQQLTPSYSGSKIIRSKIQ